MLAGTQMPEAMSEAFAILDQERRFYGEYRPF